MIALQGFVLIRLLLYIFCSILKSRAKNILMSGGFSNSLDFLHNWPYTPEGSSYPLPFDRVVEVHQQAQMRPAEFSTQGVDNLLVGKGFSQAEAVPELVFAPAFAIHLHQLLRQGGDGPFAVFCPLLLQNLAVSPAA